MNWSKGSRVMIVHTNRNYNFIYIDILCLSVYTDCLFISNKGQNVCTDPVRIFCDNSHDPTMEGLWMVKVLKMALKNFKIQEKKR